MGCKEKALFFRVPLCKGKSPLGEEALKDRTRITLDGQTSIEEGKKRKSSCLHIPKSQWEPSSSADRWVLVIRRANVVIG